MLFANCVELDRYGSAGISPATRAQGVNVVAVPQVPITSCEVWPVAAVIASVPDDVIGLPLTVSHPGTV
jgi:hypothetical protein